MNNQKSPQTIVDRMMATNPDAAHAFTSLQKPIEAMLYTSRPNGREDEREKLVCRLLAIGMPEDEISLILKIRVEDVCIIQQNNTATKIPEYTRTLREQRKRWANRSQQIYNCFKGKYTVTGKIFAGIFDI